MKTEVFYFYNQATNKHFVAIESEKEVFKSFLYIGSELMRRGLELTPFVFCSEKSDNMTKILTLYDNSFLRVGLQIAEKLLHLLTEIKEKDVEEMSYKNEKREIKQKIANLEAELEGCYTEATWRELNIERRKLEVLEAKKDGSFYQEIPQEFKTPRTNK